MPDNVCDERAFAPDTVADRREAPRRHVPYVTFIRTPAFADGRALATVRNISETGCMVESMASVWPGHQVTIRLPHARRVSGVVIWVIERRFGLAFDEPQIGILERPEFATLDE